MTSSSTPISKELEYELWMVKYSSALSSFQQITQYAKDKRVIIFLDYDGTLSPIVVDPERAIMSAEMRSAVKNVAKYFTTAIISGRSRKKVQQFIGLTELYYAGSHGMDIVGPGGSDDNQLFQPDAASEIIALIAEAIRCLVVRTKHIPGTQVEDNKFCASVHYRNVEETSWPAVTKCVEDVIKSYPRLKLTYGRKVLEVRPNIDWNKGNAVEHLLKSLIKVEDRHKVLPIYIGDDRTDEDAFKVLKNHGCGILVSSVPKPTEASFSLRNPSEVMDFLVSLVKWKKK